MLICPKCSYDNELGRMFCHSCGTKLDLSQIKAPGQGGPKLKRKKQGKPWRLVRLSLELGVLCVVMFAIYLAWQVPTAPVAKPSNADLLAADSKRFDLDRLVMRNKPDQLEVGQKEINTFLNSLVMEKPPAAWLVFVPETVQIELGDGNIKVTLWGELRLGEELKKKLFISYTCIPVVQNGILDNKPVAATFGLLPVHPLILENTSVVQRYIGGIFAKLDRERATLQKLSAITIRRERATLQYEPKPAAR